MAFVGKTIIKFSAVIKGYHAYKVSMDYTLSYRCIPEQGNCVDKAAVVVKETITGDIIGHVPATPVKLNVAMLDIVQLDGNIEILRRPTGEPRFSTCPWPESHSRGGDAVIQVEFEVHTHPKFEKQIVDILWKTTEIVPGIYNDMSILVERPGESTPSMYLSDGSELPDTPQSSRVTP